MSITDTATATPVVVMPAYLRAHFGVSGEDGTKTARVKNQLSKAGNVFYSFSAQGMDLKDGLNTPVSVEIEGEIVNIPMTKTGVSKQNNVKIEGTVDVLVAGVPYIASGLLSAGKLGTFGKVAVTKKPQPGERKPVIKGGEFE